MAPQTWYPDKVLGLGIGNEDSMFCVGHARTKGNSRCRLRVEGKTFYTICRIVNDMGTTSPKNAIDLLPRLTRLSLCQEYHQNQAHEVQREWEDMLKDVIEQYENRKVIKRLKQQVDQLTDRWEKRDINYQSLLDAVERDSVNSKELMDEVEDLHTELDQALAKSKQFEDALAKAEKVKMSLQSRINEIERSFSKSTKNSQRHEQDLNAKITEATKLLHESQRVNKAFEKYKVNAEMAQASQHQRITSLDSQLQEERQTSETVKNQLEEIKVEQANLLMETAKLNELLATERQISAGRKRTAMDAKRVQAVLQEKNGEIQSQLESERHNSERVKGIIGAEFAASEKLIHKEMENLRSLLAAERRTTKQLYGNLNSVKEENVSLSTQLSQVKESLEGTQLDLASSFRLNQEQKALAVIQDAEYTSDSARMLERIKLLEAQISNSFRDSFMRKVKTLGRRILRWIGFWRQKENIVDVEEIQEGIPF